MQITNERLLELTKKMPMKQINLKQPIPKTLEQSKKLFGELGYIGGGRDDQGFAVAYKPYIQRYYAGTFRDNKDLWLHRFLSNDGDRNTHNHPFEFSTVMLCGGYSEEFEDEDGHKDFRITIPYADSDLPQMIDLYLQKLHVPINAAKPSSQNFLNSAGQYRAVNLYDWHRIAAVENETWTAVIVNSQRLPAWFFKDESEKLQLMNASSRDWWRLYKCRPESGVASDDNGF